MFSNTATLSCDKDYGWPYASYGNEVKDNHSRTFEKDVWREVASVIEVKEQKLKAGSKKLCSYFDFLKNSIFYKAIPVSKFLYNASLECTLGRFNSFSKNIYNDHYLLLFMTSVR